MPKKSQINEYSRIVHVFAWILGPRERGLECMDGEALELFETVFECIAPLARAVTTLRGLIFHPCAC
jgi:hypothetical protein